MHIATDEDGRWVPVGSGSAVRFNLLGAVIRTAGFRARDAMKTAESALLVCSSETFARTLSSPRPMRHAEALAWLEGAISALRAQMNGEVPAPAQSTTSESGDSGGFPKQRRLHGKRPAPTTTRRSRGKCAPAHGIWLAAGP